MEIEDIIFLGAGASASEGAPLQGNLFREYFLSCQAEKDPRINKEMVQRLGTLFETFFNIDIHACLDSASFPTFEEILGMLELAINREESFKNYSLTPDKPQVQRIIQDLIFLIAIILDKKLGSEIKYHKKLVNRLRKEGRILKTTFVTSNYDILIDNALVSFFPEFHVDYGVEFTNFEKQKYCGKQWIRPDPKKSIYLFKFHGSLNWLYCPTCISLTLTPLGQRVATLVFKPQNCDDCGSEMIPIVIPPTFFKVMSNYYLQEVWRKAENVLKHAKRIFFCGYSFPDADIHIKYLLKRVETNRGSTPEIFVINNFEGKPESEKQTEELRYKRFFKNSEQVHYTDKTFQDFCDQGVGDS